MPNDDAQPNERFGRLDIDRVIGATIDDVWEAWTTERGLATWWWSGWGDSTYAVDARVGGEYRIEAPTAGIAVSGRFLRLDAPHRIEMTWVWSDDLGDGPEELVLVELRSVGDATAVSVQHTGPWASPEPAADYAVGWEHVLEQLARR